jgi:ribonuclease Z
MGLLTTMSLKGRETPLTIFGPAGLGEAIALHLRLSGSVLSYELIFQPIEAGAERRIYEDHHVTVDVVPLAHKIPCSGFIFRENPKQRRLIGDKMPPGLSSEHINMLKSGEDVVFMGEILHWEDMTLPPKPSRSYAFCSDTTYIPALAAKIGQVDVLYHEATYMADQTAKAMEHFHSTTAQAGQVAADAGVKALIIGHYSSRYADLQPLLHEAQRVFPNTYLAIEGQRYGMQWEEEGYVWYSKGTYHDIQ